MRPVRTFVWLMPDPTTEAAQADNMATVRQPYCEFVCVRLFADDADIVGTKDSASIGVVLRAAKVGAYCRLHAGNEEDAVGVAWSDSRDEILASSVKKRGSLMRRASYMLGA